MRVACVFAHVRVKICVLARRMTNFHQQIRDGTKSLGEFNLLVDVRAYIQQQPGVKTLDYHRKQSILISIAQIEYETQEDSLQQKPNRV